MSQWLLMEAATVAVFILAHAAAVLLAAIVLAAILFVANAWARS